MPARDRRPDCAARRRLRAGAQGNQQALHADVSLFFDDKTSTQRAFIPQPMPIMAASKRASARSQRMSPGFRSAISGLARRHRQGDAHPRGCRENYNGDSLLSPRAPLTAHRFHEVVRHHWGIENSLHWVLDVTMNEDQSRNRKDHSPENLALLRRLALNLAKLEPSKGSMKAKLKQAGWDNAFLAKLLAQFAHPQMRYSFHSLASTSIPRVKRCGSRISSVLRMNWNGRCAGWQRETAGAQTALRFPAHIVSTSFPGPRSLLWMGRHGEPHQNEHGSGPERR